MMSTLPACGRDGSLRRSRLPARSGKPSPSTRTIWSTTRRATLAISRARGGSFGGDQEQLREAAQ
jgi:hypothetical protein